jgi:hypothetical protein
METIVIWVLTIQLWTENPSKIKFVYTKEYPTHEECMKAQEEWAKVKEHTSLCLTKVTEKK